MEWQPAVLGVFQLLRGGLTGNKFYIEFSWSPAFISYNIGMAAIYPEQGSFLFKSCLARTYLFGAGERINRFNSNRRMSDCEDS